MKAVMKNLSQLLMRLISLFSSVIIIPPLIPFLIGFILELSFLHSEAQPFVCGVECDSLVTSIMMFTFTVCFLLICLTFPYVVILGIVGDLLSRRKVKHLRIYLYLASLIYFFIYPCHVLTIDQYFWAFIYALIACELTLFVFSERFNVRYFLAIFLPPFLLVFATLIYSFCNIIAHPISST